MVVPETLDDRSRPDRLARGRALRDRDARPDGEENPIDGIFLEVTPHTRVAMTNAFTADWMPQPPFMIRIDDFAAEAGRTRFTATARHWDEATRANHEAMGFDVGWNAAVDQLEEVARRLA